METEFVAVRAQTIEKHPGAHCASIEEIGEEMTFFSEVLHCYDICFVLIRWTRTTFTIEEIAELQGAIDKLKILWPTHRSWEQKEASVRLLPNLTTYGLQSSLNWLTLVDSSILWKIPLKSCTSLTSSWMWFIITLEITSFERSANRNMKPLPARHVEVRQQRIEQVKQNRKHKFTPATIAKRESKAEEAIAVKKERRS
jgi:hypothetical protein